MNVLPIKKCRSCFSENLLPILSLGNQYVSNFVDGEKGITVPLDLVLCDAMAKGCGLLQLHHSAPLDILYSQYWYRSGTNKTMTLALADIASNAEKLVEIKKGDIAVDIGCNDGTLLRAYSDPNLQKVGFEPGKNLIQYAEKGTDKVFNDFFNAGAFKGEFGARKAKIVTSIAMFYDLEKPNDFVADIGKILDKDGVWIIQMSYLPLMLGQNAFDNICHEHLEYYSLHSLIALLDRHNFKVFNVELNDVNGGSFRIYIRHANGLPRNIPNGSQEAVLAMLENERALKLNDKETYRLFALRVDGIKRQVHDFIKKEVSKGKTVYVYGASTKGNTLLQYFGLDNKLIKAAAERNPDKWGKATVGTLIPIISEEEARKQKPDYFLVLPWHFLEEFVQREKAYFEKGGKFIVPLPEFKIISL